MAPTRTNKQAAMASSSPKTASDQSDDREQIHAMIKFMNTEKHKYNSKIKADTKNEVDKYKKQAAVVVKRHHHLAKTHVVETTEIYSKLTGSLEEVDLEIDESKKQLQDLVKRKQELVGSLEDKIKEIFGETDQEIGNCVQALEDIVLGIAARPKARTGGLVGKHLENDVQAVLEAIKARQSDDHDGVQDEGMMEEDQ